MMVLKNTEVQIPWLACGYDNHLCILSFFFTFFPPHVSEQNYGDEIFIIFIEAIKEGNEIYVIAAKCWKVGEKKTWILPILVIS